MWTSCKVTETIPHSGKAQWRLGTPVSFGLVLGESTSWLFLDHSLETTSSPLLGRNFAVPGTSGMPSPTYICKHRLIHQWCSLPLLMLETTLEKRALLLWGCKFHWNPLSGFREASLTCPKSMVCHNLRAVLAWCTLTWLHPALVWSLESLHGIKSDCTHPMVSFSGELQVSSLWVDVWLDPWHPCHYHLIYYYSSGSVKGHFKDYTVPHTFYHSCVGRSSITDWLAKWRHQKPIGGWRNRGMYSRSQEEEDTM